MSIFHGQTILIVDDQPSNLKVLSDTLSAANLQVAVALNGESALEQIQYFQPDIILLDVMMPPGIDGFETCRRILEKPNMSEVPILFMTALTEIGHKTQGFAAGAVDYITKPFQQAEVFARVKAHLKLRQITKELASQNHQLQQAKVKAEQANRIKSEFLANISHELRTPLNGVMGYAQGLQMSDHLDNRERGWANSIYECGSHLLTLIEDVLDISKIEAEKLKLTSNPVNLTRFLKHLVSMFELRAEQAQLFFAVELDRHLPSTIEVDEKRLRQVLINLLGNAFKFTEVGGVTLRVTLSTPQIATSLTTLPKSNAATPLGPGSVQPRIRFEIEDTGIGIAAKDQAKVFEPFTQTPSSDQYHQGTGLGLSISNKIIDLMDSHIELRSEPGQGSLFAFELACL